MSITESQWMNASKLVKVRSLVKDPPFGTLIGDFSKQLEVIKVKEEYLAAEAKKDSDGQGKATKKFKDLLRKSAYYTEVKGAVENLVAEMKTMLEKADFKCLTNALTTTRLDFAVQAIFQILQDGSATATYDDLINSIASTATTGGYKLDHVEALYRERSGSFEEGVGTFITALLDLKENSPDLWVDFKCTELKWSFYNFCMNGIGVSVNIFPSDMLYAEVRDTLLQLHAYSSDAFALLLLELLEHETIGHAVINMIIKVNRQTGLRFAKDDISMHTLANDAKCQELIDLFKKLKGILTTAKLDSGCVCTGFNVPLVPRFFDREKKQFDVEVAGKRILRETFCIGMPAAKRQMVLKYPVNILNAEHWTQKSVEMTIMNEKEAVEYASSMSGGRAFSDAIVEHLMKPINDNGASVALLNARHSMEFAGDDEASYFVEDTTVYTKFVKPEKSYRLSCCMMR